LYFVKKKNLHRENYFRLTIICYRFLDRIGSKFKVNTKIDPRKMGFSFKGF
jgi:hypothetical protein